MGECLRRPQIIPAAMAGFSGQLIQFDNMGRAIKTSNPTETNAIGVPINWDATGDDDRRRVGFTPSRLTIGRAGR